MSAPDRLGLVLSGVMQRDEALELQACGDSMFPLIRSGDVCRFVGCEPGGGIRAGDVVLYCAESGKLVAHRVHRVLRDDGPTAAGHRVADGGVARCLLLCKGDANAGFDRVIESGQCVGKLLWIRRGNGTATLFADHRAAVWWGRLVLAFPLISRLLRRWLDWSRRGGAALRD
jgi:signal peptidase